MSSSSQEDVFPLTTEERFLVTKRLKDIDFHFQLNQQNIQTIWRNTVYRRDKGLPDPIIERKVQRNTAYLNRIEQMHKIAFQILSEDKYTRKDFDFIFEKIYLVDI